MAIDVELKAPAQTNNTTWPLTFKASDRFPIVANRVFATLANAQAYVNDTEVGASAYPGIVLTVVQDTPEKNGVYYVKSVATKTGEVGELVKTGTDNGNGGGNGSDFFVEGISQNSVVLKGGNNFAGLKGWYYKAMQINKGKKYMCLYLTRTQVVPDLVTGATNVTNQEKDIPFNLPIGTKLSLINDVKYDNQFELIENEMDKYGRVRLTWLTDEIPFEDVKKDEELINLNFDPEDYSIYCLDEPSAGISDMGQYSVAIGLNNKATNNKAISFGYNNHSYGKFSFTEGRDNKAAYASHAEGNGSQANGLTSHAEGGSTEASGDMSHSEGYKTKTLGKCAHAEGRETQAIGANSHAEGQLTQAEKNNSHAEGYMSKASGMRSHAEGYNTHAIGLNSHSEGFETKANANNSHAEGCETIALGECSHAEGAGTITNNYGEHACGIYNKSLASSADDYKTLFSIGFGKSDEERKNALEIRRNGDIYININGTVNKIQNLLQEKLVSGVNFATIDGRSLLDEVDIKTAERHEISYAPLSAYIAGQAIYNEIDYDLCCGKIDKLTICENCNSYNEIRYEFKYVGGEFLRHPGDGEFPNNAYYMCGNKLLIARCENFDESSPYGYERIKGSIKIRENIYAI